MATNMGTVRRRLLGGELRRARERAGCKAEEAAAHLECSMSKISRIENGMSPVKARDVRDLLEWYGVMDPAQVKAVMQLHKDAQEQGWWEPYEDQLPSGMATYAGFECEAVALRAYEPMFVHGLLQTEDYARAVIGAANPSQAEAVENLVRFRMQRQQVQAERDEPVQLWVVLEESALRRPVGGRQVMASQIDHLIAAAARPDVTLQIMPTAKDAHAAMAGAFALMEFAAAIPTVVYVDSIAGNLYLEKEREVRSFTQTFDLVRAAGPDPQETPATLEIIAREMRTP